MLAFHIALVRNPQEALVVWAFSSLLYFGTWSEAMTFVKQIDGNEMAVDFLPEIRCEVKPMSEKMLKEKLLNLTSLVRSSVHAFSCVKSLQECLTVFSEASEFSGQVCTTMIVGPADSGMYLKGASLYHVSVDNLGYCQIKGKKEQNEKLDIS